MTKNSQYYSSAEVTERLQIRQLDLLKLLKTKDLNELQRRSFEFCEIIRNNPLVPLRMDDYVLGELDYEPKEKKIPTIDGLDRIFFKKSAIEAYEKKRRLNNQDMPVALPEEGKKPLDTHVQQANKARHENIFKKKNESWTFFYTGMQAPIEGIKDQKGFHYIKYLLMNPHKEFSAINLETCISGAPDIDPSALEPQSTSIHLQHQNTKSLRKLKEVLEEKLSEQAEEDDPNTRWTQENLRAIEDELARRQGAPEQKQRDKIRKAIKSAMDTIEIKTDKDPDLYLHLKNHFFSVKWPITYNPEKSTNWAD